MSVCTRPIEAAMSAVSTPTIATIVMTCGACSNSTAFRPTRYTPAVTIVAAWINAETGVGPSIASGSQTCSGICALFPVAPTNRSRQIADSTPNVVVSTGSRRGGDFTEIERAEGIEDQEDAEDEAPIADAVDDERFLASVARALLLVPVADEQA